MTEAIRNVLWGVPTLMLLLVFGIYFTLKSGFYRPRAVISTVKGLKASLKSQSSHGVSPLAAVATALGGTVGVGSIIGVGYALSVGGAGSIFWMWVCSFFGIGLKYAEVKIALSGRKNTFGIKSGGAPFRLAALGYKRTALFFCAACLLASFFTGNVTQTGAVALSLSSVGANSTAVAIICVCAVALAVFGGRRRIASLNAFLVPAASFIYLFACVFILILNRRGIIPSVCGIFREAFGFKQLCGGFSGAVLAHALREGFARSLFSNEAGMGSSPLAHATADTENIELQARWGIFEVFFDSFAVSTVTAICLLSGGYSSVTESFFKAFGNIGTYGFAVLTAIFAFASVISWCYYGECCIAYRFPNGKYVFFIYRALFALCSCLGVFISGNAAFAAADIFNALMMLPNLFLLFLCRDEIERME